MATPTSTGSPSRSAGENSKIHATLRAASSMAWCPELSSTEALMTRPSSLTFNSTVTVPSMQASFRGAGYSADSAARTLLRFTKRGGTVVAGAVPTAMSLGGLVAHPKASAATTTGASLKDGSGQLRGRLRLRQRVSGSLRSIV